jgi:electron transfer flavoprotein alpha/beta subunit
LAIGANDAVRVNLDPKDSFSTAKEIAAVAQNGGYDLSFAVKNLSIIMVVLFREW